eukprot:GAHX01002398.1.p1 GENE.GAHX01002398.1~~GAHX01002398.1.p1  ORF type:complete len:255 (+),score=32.02 GAHX01002398.1:38-766(+)
MDPMNPREDSPPSNSLSLPIVTKGRDNTKKRLNKDYDTKILLIEILGFCISLTTVICLFIFHRHRFFIYYSYGTALMFLKYYASSILSHLGFFESFFKSDAGVYIHRFVFLFSVSSGISIFIIFYFFIFYSLITTPSVAKMLVPYSIVSENFCHTLLPFLLVIEVILKSPIFTLSNLFAVFSLNGLFLTINVICGFFRVYPYPLWVSYEKDVWECFFNILLMVTIANICALIVYIIQKYNRR